MPKRVGITMPLARVWAAAFAVGLYSCVSLLKSRTPFVHIPDIPSGLDAVLSLAMALLIAFRIKQAYERWWEARTLWGSLVNVSRNLAIKVRELERPDAKDRRKVRDLIVAYCVGLKNHLRDDSRLDTLPGGSAVIAAPEHVPSHVVGLIYAELNRWSQEGRLSAAKLWILDAELRVFLEVCGGCERIKNTLMPISWRWMTWQCIAIYLIVLPWGLVSDFGIWTIPLTVIAAYIVLASEAVAHYVEEPFGEHEDHLDLQRLCDVIDCSVGEILVTADEPATAGSEADR